MPQESQVDETQTKLGNELILFKNIPKIDINRPGQFNFNLGQYILDHYSLMPPLNTDILLSCLSLPRQRFIEKPKLGFESEISDHHGSAAGNATDLDDMLDISEDITSGLQDINSIELWKAVRKLSDKKVQIVVKIVYDNKAMTFGDLLKVTRLNVNDLNHVLGNLRQSNLVIRTEDKRYYLTKFCIALLESLNGLRDRLSELNYSEFSHPAIK
jgi:predicted transcriptional regulator